MNTQLIFTILAMVLILIAIACYLLLKNGSKEKPKEQTTKYDVLNYQEKERLSELNKVVERQKEIFKQPEHTIEQATIINLKASIKSLEEQNKYLNQMIESKNRLVNLKEIEIKRIKEENQKKPTNFDFSIKVGDTVKGRIIPNGKKYISGKVTSITRRGNLVLDNKHTVSHVDAIFLK